MEIAEFALALFEWGSLFKGRKEPFEFLVELEVNGVCALSLARFTVDSLKNSKLTKQQGTL